MQAGDVAAYGHLVKRYERLVFGVAYHMLGNVEDARDVAQDVFLRAFVRIGQVRDSERFGSWLRQVAVNECRAFASKRKERWPALCTPSQDVFAQAENRLVLAEALQAIDETSRLTVILFYLQAYSLKEIGSFLDEPVTTIKSRLRNARAKLRREMEKMLEKRLEEESLPEDFADRVTRMIEAARTGDSTTIRALLDKDPGLVGVEEVPGRHTPLHIAAASGDASLVELLLSYGADPNYHDESDNASAMHYAAERGWLDCVKLLVEAGCDVNWNQDVHERGPLGWAVFFGAIHRDVADYLMEHGAKLDLFSAIALARGDVIRELVAADPNVLRQRTSEVDSRLSAIEFATSKGRFEMAELLVELGAEVGLAEAAALGSTDRVALLLPGQSRDALNHAVDAAVKAGQIETTRQLLEAGADPDFAGDGRSLIFYAIESNRRALAELLLEFGANLDYRDVQWKSNTLGWEVFFGKPETTKMALELGSTVDPHLLELARSGERGELRRFCSGTAEGYRKVAEMLEAIR